MIALGVYSRNGRDSGLLPVSTGVSGIYGWYDILGISFFYRKFANLDFYPDTALMSSITQSLKNHFLIAMPRMADPSFAKTLTLICEHSKDGALGIIINRPTDLKLQEVFSQIGIEEPEICSRSPETVFSGGPVAKERGFVLHSGEARWESTLRINNGLQLTSSRDILFAMATDEGPENAIVALGYSGWGKGQLEQEISDNSWLTCVTDNSVIFDTPFHYRLDAAASLIGVNLKLMSNQVGHA